MKRKVHWVTIGAVGALSLFFGTAQAEYNSSARSAGAETGQDSFRRAVDPGRFRKGNPDWDTQQLIASGLTALHEEHAQILKQIEELKTAVSRLEKAR